MPGPPYSSSTDSQIGVLPSHKPLQAANTVAAGSSPRFIQLPSPVYVVSWISTTHVLIAAGGGGSRFGMVNVLILLSIHLSNDNDAEMENTAACLGLSVKLNEEQHKMVVKAASPSSDPVSGSIEAGVRVPHLWRFVAGLDLGSDVPWCASKYLPLERAEAGCSKPDDTIPVSTREWTLETCQCLRYAHGIIALSSICTFSLIAVEYVPQNSQKGESIQTSESSCSETYRLTLLARVALPTETNNEDKKPIAMVRYAVIVAHDACGIHAYDLRPLLLGGEGEGKGGAVAPVTQATPMAKWALPDRVNDLHADRFSWVSVKASPLQTTQESHLQSISPKPSYKALALDYVLVAALVRDKTLRLGSFLQYGPHAPLRRLCRGQEHLDGIDWESEEEEQSETELVVIETIKEEAVLTGVDCGLQFNLLPSSMRLVRLFGLETLSSSAQDAALRALTLRIAQHAEEPLMPLPLVSLLMVVYDQHSNQSFFLHAQVLVWSCSGTLSSEKGISAKCDGKCEGNSCRRGRRGGHPIHCQIHLGAGGPSPIVKDAIICFSPCLDMDVRREVAPKQTQVNFQSAVGASIPTHWLAGTAEGWIVLVVRNPRIQQEELGVDSLSCANLSAKDGMVEGMGSSYIGSEHSGVSESFFVLRHARPSLLLSRSDRPGKVSLGRGKDHCWGNPDVPLHYEPVTAVAVSKLNDVLSTDIAQNVVLSTLPVPVRASNTAILPNYSESIDLLPKVEGLELFPKALGFHAKIVGALAATNALLMRLRWILLILTVLWGIFILFC
ncbi:unnamed protein product [Phytomonas sp. EM1]|nr:unnamed protein product [Phytomonas sp. EM1]|eukprot:CCW59662.1 unnamed protein product [Phytomonas sp. isolate EM1]